MNSITVAGNITRDAELREAGQDDVLSFSVADNQGKDKPAIFWNCSLWGKRAQALEQYLTKGQAVTVSGTVTEREYVDKEGNQRKSMDIKVQEVALQGGRRDEQSSDREPRRESSREPQRSRPPERSRSQERAPERQAPPRRSSNFDNMDDDIPF
jgi:single-strand DNA-binding protein